MQLIFVVESNSKSQTDYKYISETIKHYYNISSVKLTPIYANGKGNLIKCDSKIKECIKKYSNKTVVIICYDVDNPLKQDHKLNVKIEEYVKKNCYESIWFNEDVEDVYLKKKVPESDKTKEANIFISNSLINSNDYNLSESIKNKKNSSNILIIIDNHLKRKKN